MERNTAGMRGKDDDRKLFVGGLPRQCEEKDLRDAFSQFGDIESINIKMDPYTGQSRGFCFIVFTDSSIVERVLSHGEISIQGKKVDPRKVTKSLIPGKLFVGGVTPELGEEKLREYFEQYGKITELQWPYDKVKNQRRAYCFITFENKDTVNELLKRPKQTVGGIELDVKRVKFNPETMWQPGYARPPRGYGAPYPPPYPPAYGQIDYREDYGYDDYYGAEGTDPYYDGYTAAYDSYAPPAYSAPVYAQRAPRGGRNAGGYARHAPY